MIKRTKVRNSNKRKKNRRLTKKGGFRLGFRLTPQQDLFDAIKYNDLEKVEAWGKITKTRDVNLFENGKNPLTCAISLNFSDEKNLNIIKDLVTNKKANINTMGRSCDNNVNYTPLMFSIKHEKINVMKFLLEEGAAVDKLDNDNNTIFNFACNKGNSEIVNALFENIKLKNCTKELLQNINQKTYDSQINNLLEDTSYSYILNNIINYPNKLGKTALIYACENGKLDIVNKLLEKGAAVDKVDNDNNTIFNFACNNGNLEIVNSLLKKISSFGENYITNFINYPNKLGKTALIYACENGNSEIVNKLLEKGASVNLDCNNIFNKLLITDNLLYCKTALMYACENGKLDIVNALLNKNADVNAYNKTSLMYACENERLDIVNKLLEKDNEMINVNVNVHNKTALMYACENENLDIVNALLNKGADPKAYGKTALTYACENRNSDIYNLLKKNKPGPKACGDDKDLIDSPLMIAFTKQNTDIIKALSTKINDDSYFKKVKKYYDDLITTNHRHMILSEIVGSLEKFSKNGM